MNLSTLLDGVTVTKLFSMGFGKMVMTQDLEICGIAYDSRKVNPGYLFVAIRGTTMDGHQFIDAALRNGATAVMVEDDNVRNDAFFLHQGVPKIVVPDCRRALARISTTYYGHPSQKLRLIGVTGTNGKTTTTHLLRSVVQESGQMVGMIGTVQHMIGNEVVSAAHTTPESLELNQLLAAMVRKGCSTAVMEVSSHALAMHRVDGLQFAAAVFTNLTQDHLDFHGSMENYCKTKRLLFDGLSDRSYAVINADDPYGAVMVEGTRAQIMTYGATRSANVRADDISLDIHGVEFTVTHDGTSRRVSSALTGLFNTSNITAAYATGLALEIPESTIVAGIANMGPVRGRFEQIPSPQGWTAIIDYAHTPDALDNCLRAIRQLASTRDGARVITVFGCGGNRDKGKRPIMGRIASTLSDVTIITSDNPRHEDPLEIMREIRNGIVQGANVSSEVDRRKAIVMGLKRARPGDIVLIAGKGHEDYQVIGDSRLHFDDREEVERYIQADV
jgi:UDP-N-acetylmuramoyl-L-alanyl-D-glutamate--2,6-diaminopimelate ligase